MSENISKKFIAKVIAIALIVCGAIGLTGCDPLFQAMDGGGMSRTWKEYELMNVYWEEVTDSETFAELSFEEDTCTYKNYYSLEGTAAYTIEGNDNNYDFESNRTINIQGDLCESLIFHYEEYGGDTFGVLSVTAEELDGRGTIIVMEFVPKDIREQLPTDYSSELCKQYNDSEAVPSYMEIGTDSEAADADAELDDATEIISEMIIAYGYEQGSAEAIVEENLAQLAAIDPELAAKWRDIMDYWKYTINEQELNMGVAPDGLANDDSLCFMVLGYKLNSDGSIRDELEGRLQTALACAKKYPNAYVMVTGGGTASANPNVTEADQMASWLKENGVSEDRIIIENKSMTTGQNARNSYRILSENYPQITDLVVVSSDYHIGWGSVLYQAACILGGECEITGEGANAAAGNPATTQAESTQQANSASENTQAGSNYNITLHASVISNAAYDAHNTENYPFYYQAAGLLELAGNSETAYQLYYGTYKYTGTTKSSDYGVTSEDF